MNKKASLASSLISFFFALGVLLTIRWAFVEPYVIPSGSMIPSLLINDHILVSKSSFGLRMPFSKKWLTEFHLPKRGDVVVFRSVKDDDYFMIKRVIGLPGDTVEYNKQGKLFINGRPVPQKQLSKELRTHKKYYPVTPDDVGGSYDRIVVYEEVLGQKSYRTLLDRYGYRFSNGKYVIPKGQLFVMGDNRDNSRDSRYWGSFPVENLLGKALFVWLSCDETLNFANFLCNPMKIRWRRFFHSIQ